MPVKLNHQILLILASRVYCGLTRPSEDPVTQFRRERYAQFKKITNKHK